MNKTEKVFCPHCQVNEHEREPLWKESDSDFCEIEDFEGGKQIATCRNGVDFDWSFVKINFCPICGRDFSKQE